jgi:hypothetical protein
MAKIVISYRRSDSDAIAGRIRDRLASRFGEDSLFMDIDNIPFGIDFREHIKTALLSSDVVIVVVGPSWLGPGNSGHWRIKDESDPVRIEVETALQKNIPVVPVLVNNATMPRPEDLPDIKDFAFRNAAEVETGRDFHAHMERLIRSLERIVPAPGPALAPTAAANTAATAKWPHGGRTAVLALGYACLGALAVAGGLWFVHLGGQTSPSAGNRDSRSTATTTNNPPPAEGCASRIGLDENRIPEPGNTLRDALKGAVSAYFQCSSGRLEQFARTFATLSVVIAHYAPSASCFNGDPGAPSLQWSGHKAWADRQGNPDSLMGNLRAKIDFALGCMERSQQQLFFVDMSRAFGIAAADLPSYTFRDPTLMGKRIDRCLYYARACNEEAALAWCQQNGFARTTQSQWVYVSPTYALGDRKTCDLQTCGGFSVVDCAN